VSVKIQTAVCWMCRGTHVLTGINSGRQGEIPKCITQGKPTRKSANSWPFCLLHGQLTFSVLTFWHRWLDVRKGIWPDEVLAWLSVWSNVHMICKWFSWCHCHPIISCFIKIQNGLTFLVPAYLGCPGIRVSVSTVLEEHRDSPTDLL